MSTSQDRTAEFMALIDKKRNNPKWIQRRESYYLENAKVIKPAPDPQYKEFMRFSLECSKQISAIHEKLEKFSNLAKKRSVFDEGELNRLISEIRRNISESKKNIDDLQAIHDFKKHKHTETIVEILQQRFVDVTGKFKSTLETRSRDIQQQAARQEMFASPSTSTNQSPFSQPQNQNHSNSSNHYDNNNHHHDNNAIPMFVGGNQLMQTQQVLQHDHVDLNDRIDKMQEIESTIVELSTVFNQLASMVQVQGETITRIDMNVEDTDQNIESAHDALLRYFASINNNRWLMLKVFGVLFFLFITFVIFGT